MPGSTAWGFTTYVLVQNPNDRSTPVLITYTTPDGPVVQPEFIMEPGSRKTIQVERGQVGRGQALSTFLSTSDGAWSTDFSTRVHADLPIVAERAMYWNGGPDGGQACHASIGVPAASYSFLLPDGQTNDGHETYTCVQNPNTTAVTVDITYLLAGGGTPPSFSDTIPAKSRRTYNMADKVRAVISSGTGGTLWNDYIVNSYDEQAQSYLLTGARWEFYSIMLPDEDAAIMAIRLTNGHGGVVQIGNLFRMGGPQAHNSAHRA